MPGAPHGQASPSLECPLDSLRVVTCVPALGSPGGEPDPSASPSPHGLLWNAAVVLPSACTVVGLLPLVRLGASPPAASGAEVQAQVDGASWRVGSDSWL